MSRPRHNLTAALICAAVLALLTALFHDIDAAEVGSLLEQAGPAVLLVLVPHGVSMTLESWAWHRAIAFVGPRPPFGPVWLIRTATEALYLLVPGGVVAAETLKPLLLERRAGLRLELGVGATLYRKYLRLAGQGPFVLVAAAVGGTALQGLSQRWLGVNILYHGTLALGVLFCGMAAALSLVMRRTGPLSALSRALGRLPSQRLRGALTRSLERFEAADQFTRSFFRLPARLAVPSIAVSGACWLLEPLESWLALRVIGVDVSFELVLGVDVAISLLRQLAFMLPAGVGLQEAGYVGALFALGAPAPLESAAVLSLLKRSKDLVWGVSGLAVLAALFGPQSRAKSDQAAPGLSLRGPSRVPDEKVLVA